tara:strand:- start:902 stop:1105 length:204 start_codon:yes stop_codon:yes gene_type:complete
VWSKRELTLPLIFKMKKECDICKVEFDFKSSLVKYEDGSLVCSAFPREHRFLSEQIGNKTLEVFSNE